MIWGVKMVTAAFKQSIEKALKNLTLRTALGKFAEAYIVAREKAYSGINFEQLRDRISEIKADSAPKLKELALEFKKNAEANGAKVFIANSPDEAREYILKVAKQRGVKKVVKSKSMASEEIHLNPYLLEAGMEVRETDLGEWIIQLAKHRPSHMVLPAIHLTKEEVAELFTKEVNEKVKSDIPQLVKIARRELRNVFLSADMGITGANIAVAETGSIVIIENEGNARLVTTLPKIHVVLVGLEKLVPYFSNIVPILTALPKSATAQICTSYFSIITGQTPNVDGTLKDLHIVLLDNKRTDMAKDPIFKEALQCIRCASCLNVCPVFCLIGGHVFGSIYTGGIGTILTAWFEELKKCEDIQGLCIQCGRCRDLCPGKINIPELILELRRRLEKEKGPSFLQKTFFSIIKNRRLFHQILRNASKVQKPFVKEGFIRHLPMFFSSLTEYRSLPPISDTPLRDRLLRFVQPDFDEKVVFFAGCLIDFVYPEIGESVIKVLNKAGFTVLFPQEQGCCGAPANYSGSSEVAYELAKENIEAILRLKAKYVVSACPTCTTSLKYDYIFLFKTTGHEDMLPKAEIVASKTYDFSSLIKVLINQQRLEPEKIRDFKEVTYHDSCHLKRRLHVYREPREILEGAGYEILEMYEADMCCGMGGYYTLKFPEISSPILERKLRNIKNTNAKLVVMDCPGCLLQIRGGFDKKSEPIETRHIAEVIG